MQLRCRSIQLRDVKVLLHVCYRYAFSGIINFGNQAGNSNLPRSMPPLEAQRAWEAQAQLQKLEAQVRQQQEQVAQVPGMTMVVVKGD